MNLKDSILGKVVIEKVIEMKSVVKQFFQIPVLLALLLISYVFVGKLFHLSALHFPHLKNENNTSLSDL